MKTKAWLAVIILTGNLSPLCASEQTFSCNFDNFTEGLICGQQGWKLVRGGPDGFIIQNGCGTTGSPGDKALRIEFESKHSTLLAPYALSWMPDEIWSLELDFKLELSPEQNTQTNILMALLMGDPDLTDRLRWIEALGALPDGKWSWIGGAPNWILDRDLPASRFLVRSKTDRAESPWFHLSFSTEKSRFRNRFHSILNIARLEDGKAVLQQVYDTDPVHTKMASNLWNLKTMSFGFCQGKASPKGSVWIDNIKVTSVSSEKEDQTSSTKRQSDSEKVFASINCKRPFTWFRNNHDVSSDEWGGVFESVPERFRDFKVSQNRFNSQEPLEFTVKNPGLVYLVMKRWQTKQLIRDGWSIVGQVDVYREEVRMPRTPLVILEKHLEADEHKLVSLGNSGTQILKP